MSFGFGFSRPANFYGGYLWTPSQISTDLWLDASDSSTITLNGSTVSQWSDKSGNARHFTQPTAANQPGYSTGALNGLPILTFDGVNDFLDGGSILPATDGIVAYIIARQNTIGASTIAPFLGRINSTIANGNWMIRGVVSGSGQGAFASVRTDVAQYSGAVSAAPATSWFLYGIRYSNTLNQVNAIRAGFAGPSATTAGTVATNPTETCRIAARSGGTITYLHMDIAEVVVLLSSVAVGAQNARQIEGYLCWKYGLQATLPATHSYRNVPPTI